MLQILSAPPTSVPVTVSLPSTNPQYTNATTTVRPAVAVRSKQPQLRPKPANSSPSPATQTPTVRYFALFLKMVYLHLLNTTTSLYSVTNFVCSGAVVRIVHKNRGQFAVIVTATFYYLQPLPCNEQLRQ